VGWKKAGPALCDGSRTIGRGGGSAVAGGEGVGGEGRGGCIRGGPSETIKTEEPIGHKRQKLGKEIGTKRGGKCQNRMELESWLGGGTQGNFSGRTKKKAER